MKKIEIKANLSVKNIRDFTQELLELDDELDLSLDFKNLKRADLVVLQLLAVLKKDAVKIKRKIKLINISQDLKMQMYMCGIIKKM